MNILKAIWYFITAKFYRFKAWIFLQVLRFMSLFDEKSKKYYAIGLYRYKQQFHLL